MPKIGIVSFGSLVNNPGSLKIALPWREDGPIIKIQYSRISQNGRLVLVIDEENGNSNQSFHSESEFTTLNEAVANFQERENIDRNRVGIINVRNNSISPELMRRHPLTARGIHSWARSNRAEYNYDYVIFCDLGIRFRDAIDQRWSVENALNYIQGLDAITQMECVKYILNVPSSIVTTVGTEFKTLFNLSFDRTPENSEEND